VKETFPDLDIPYSRLKAIPEPHPWLAARVPRLRKSQPTIIASYYLKGILAANLLTAFRMSSREEQN